MWWRTFCLLCLSAPLTLADSYPRQPGIDVLHYTIALELLDHSNLLRATTRVEVLFLRDGLDTFRLDFGGLTVDTITSDGEAVLYTRVPRGIGLNLERPSLKGEKVSFEISYHGPLGSSGLLSVKNRFGRRAFFAENWPDHAHDWFPCVDHPGDKATVDFDVTAPRSYAVIASGRLQGEEVLTGSRTRSRWSEKVPIPTYCMVVGAADFEVIQPPSFGSVPLSYWVYPQDAGRADRKFARTADILKFFESLLGPYPFEKLAQVESTTHIGGMENAGNIFYAEGLFKKDPSDDAPVPHEIAHQWFGNSVTPADWDHLWLSEGFATYLDALFLEHTLGRAGFEKRMVQATVKVREYERDHPGPVVDPRIIDPLKKLNPLSYEKGAWVLHMLRAVLGDEAFLHGMREFYADHRQGNALSSDFQRAMERVGGVRLDWFFDEWLFRPGHPVYEVSWSWNWKAREIELIVRQKQRGEPFEMPAQLSVWASGQRHDHTVWIRGRSASLRVPSLHRPERVEFDPANQILKELVVNPVPE